MTVKSTSFRGIPLATADVGLATQQILAAARKSEPTEIRFVNSYSVALAEEDPAYRRLLTQTGINFVDGRPLHWALKALGEGMRGHAPGPAVFEEVMNAGVEFGLSHYFYGTSAQTLEGLAAEAQRKFPEIKIAGASAPGFGSVDGDELKVLETELELTRPNIVWVALGTPKQDLVARTISLNNRVVVAAVGAAFDFTAGTKQRAPVWMQRVGLEWFFRLLSEPRRLWRRYLWGNVTFVKLVGIEFLQAVLPPRRPA